MGDSNSVQAHEPALYNKRLEGEAYAKENIRDFFTTHNIIANVFSFKPHFVIIAPDHEKNAAGIEMCKQIKKNDSGILVAAAVPDNVKTGLQGVKNAWTDAGADLVFSSVENINVSISTIDKFLCDKLSNQG